MFFHNFIYFIILKYIFCVFFTINTQKRKGNAGYWDYGVMEDTFAMKVPGVSAARMAAMEGRKPNEADLEKDKKENSL